MATSDTRGSRGRVVVRVRRAWPSPRGGGVTPPEPPRVSDVVCISKCGGVHKATVDSKVQVSGRHLGHVSEVLFNADRRRPDRGSSRSPPPAAWSRPRFPTAPRPGKPKVIDSYDNGARSPKTLRIVGPEPDPGRELQAPGRLREAAEVLLLRHQKAARDLHVHEQRADRACGSTSSSEGAARWWTAGWSPPRSRTRATRPSGTGSGAAARSRLATADTGSASAPRSGQHGVDQRRQVQVPPLQVPDSAAATPTVTGSAPRGRATATRARTSLPVAAPRWWRPAAAGCSGRPTTRAPATTW